MPRRHELGDLVLLAKQRCDLENDENIDTAEWKTMMSMAYSTLAATVSETGLRYFETTFAIVSTGAVSYDEPDDHFMTVGIDRIINAAGQRRTLCEIMAQERAIFAGRTGDAVAFAHIDDQYFLLPKPPAGHTFELLYVYQPPDFSGEDDDYVVDVVTPDGEAFLLWGVAVMALAKHKHDARLAIKERDEARQRVFEWSTLKNIHAARRPVVDDLPSVLMDPGDWGWGNY